jgi:hypothetical protein
VQAACTPKELKELLNTEGLATRIPPPGLEVTDEDKVTSHITSHSFPTIAQGTHALCCVPMCSQALPAAALAMQACASTLLPIAGLVPGILWTLISWVAMDCL